MHFCSSILRSRVETRRARRSRRQDWRSWISLSPGRGEVESEFSDTLPVFDGISDGVFDGVMTSADAGGGFGIWAWR